MVLFRKDICREAEHVGPRQGFELGVHRGTSPGGKCTSQ